MGNKVEVRLVPQHTINIENKIQREQVELDYSLFPQHIIKTGNKTEKEQVY